MDTAPPQWERILRAQAGDEPALEDLIREYQERVAGFVISRTSEVEQCEDLCQTIFVKMVLALPRLRSPETFEPWLFRIARNVCHDHLRRRRWRRKLFVPFERAHEAVASPAAGEPREGGSAVREAMRHLVPEQRRLVELSIEAPRSYEELARLADSSVPAVKSRLFRARERLRRLLSNGGSSDET
jgi:RNA polymerase sigma-70 factor (ECF subfamily)